MAGGFAATQIVIIHCGQVVVHEAVRVQALKRGGDWIDKVEISIGS